MQSLPESAAGHRFAADAMLGRLARWLRVLGFDTSYDAALDDRTLVARAAEQGRILLTRDRLLLRDLRPARAVQVRHDAPLEQLRDLVLQLDLPAPGGLFTRCMLCNTELPPPLAPEQADALVPEGVRGIPGGVRQCPGCGRIYWLGSHARRMREALQRTLPDWLP